MLTDSQKHRIGTASKKAAAEFVEQFGLEELRVQGDWDVAAYSCDNTGWPDEAWPFYQSELVAEILRLQEELEKENEVVEIGEGVYETADGTTIFSSHVPVHSCGPWQIGGEYSNQQDEIEDYDGKTICVVWTRTAIPGASARPQFKDVPKLKANASLIAAAPELLDALHACLNIVQDEYELDSEPEDLWSWKRAIDNARAAIAKATGH